MFNKEIWKVHIRAVLYYYIHIKWKVSMYKKQTMLTKNLRHGMENESTLTLS